MATISLRVSDEEKRIISEFSKKNNKTVSEIMLSSVLTMIEDQEDYALCVERMLDPNNKVVGDLKDLAEKYGIDYESL